MLYLTLIVATLFTSLVSGVLSMAGGMILMGIFGLFLSVPVAMVLHGIAQSFSNGSRVWLYRQHIRWGVLIPYSIGSLLVLITFVLVTLVPNKGLVFFLIGLFPFLTLIVPNQVHLNIEQPVTAFVCGLLVTTAQMLAGASGPVLDIFYVNSKLSRFEVLGTKAITQTLGHLIKLGYYGAFLGISTGQLPLWLMIAVIIAALGGNWLGKLVVDRLNDHLFRRIGRIAILLIGVAYIFNGLREWGLY